MSHLADRLRRFVLTPFPPKQRTPANPIRHPKSLWLLAPVLLIGVFLTDISTPFRLALPIFYVIGLLLVVTLRHPGQKMFAAATCTALGLFSYFLPFTVPRLPAWVSVFNDSLGVAMLWTVAILSVRHRQVQEGMRDNERIANDRLAQLKTIYASAPVGLCFVDRELRFVSINDALAQMYGRAPDYFLGKTVREAVPELADTVEVHYRRVIDSGVAVVDEEVQGIMPERPRERTYSLCSYYPVYTEGGELLGVNVSVLDITRRKEMEADTLFLLDLGECIRFAANADELLWAVAVALGEHLKVSRCGFIEVDAEQGRFTVQRDYHPHLPSLVGSYSLEALGPAVIEGAKAGQTTIVSNVDLDERTAKFLKTFRDFSVGAFVVTPMLRDGKLVSALLVAASEPHEWTERQIGLVNMVAERTWLAVEKLRLDQALRESDAALRDADRRKDEFLATLAHELRNPLSLMRNVIALKRTPGTPESDSRWGQEIIERQVNYLTRLTDDLFDVSRIARDKLILQKEPLNLTEVIRAAVEASRPLIEQRGHELTVIMSQDSVYVEGDRVRLTQVFMNLLNNAAKYTPDPGHIWLNVEKAGDMVVVRVKDTGVGIAPEHLPHLFELFYQVDRSFTRTEGGLGLGLTLVHRLVSLHNGKVQIRSDGVNRGTEVFVHLPALAELPIEERGEPSDGDGAPPSHPGRRILVADDFPQSAEVLAKLLRQDGNEVYIAQDGIEAIEVAAQIRPHVAVLDLAMPKLNGYQAARVIREQPWGKDVFLIALTGWGNQIDRQRTKEAGFDEHLTKPAKYETFMELLARLPAERLPDSNRHEL